MKFIMPNSDYAADVKSVKDQFSGIRLVKWYLLKNGTRTSPRLRWSVVPAGKVLCGSILFETTL